ncbi:MAG: tryptophan--tRNA ligase [Bacilli bacterium]
MKERVLTGLRPTGCLHLGHYFGAIVNYIKLQNDYEFYLEIADVQALTDNFANPDQIRQNIQEVTCDLLACGINPKKATIFIQSMIPEIAELTVYYSNLVTMARLYRNPTVKAEINQKKVVFGNKGEGVTYGFVGYPVSQAADITVFKGKYIPVGDDQLPLIEQCREIVRKFNYIYGDVLIEPEPILSSCPRLKGLDGNDKMGKSLDNAIYLVDNEEIVSKKIMMTITDHNKIKKTDPADPNVCMVYYYHNLVSNDCLENICDECKRGKRGCVACKKELIANVLHFMKPIQERRKYYEEHPEIVNDILVKGTNKARLEAKNSIKEIKNNMKINYFKEN